MQMKNTTSVLLFMCMAAGLLSGCTQTYRRTYPERDPQQLWSALVAASQSPGYADWHVTENIVTPQPEDGRIDIYRTLRRKLYRPDAAPLNEQRTWHLRILVEDLDPPVVAFKALGVTIPARVMKERDRFFGDVTEFLESGVPEDLEPIEPTVPLPVRPPESPLPGEPQPVDER